MTRYLEVNIVKIEVLLVGGGSDVTSCYALHILCDWLILSTFGKIFYGEVLVGGNFVLSFDFIVQLRHGIVLVFLFVMSIIFVLMFVVFGLIVILVMMIGFNLLLVGVVYGVFVVVFQKGWGVGFFGMVVFGAIELWILLFVFVVLFGLLMDYYVFVVLWIKEVYDVGMFMREVVGYGIWIMVGVVISAVVIMVVVFVVFGILLL